MLVITPTRVQPFSRRKRTSVSVRSLVEASPLNTKLPGAGWMPGAKHHITGPFFISGAVALHSGTSDGPRISLAPPPMSSVASCTAICGLDCPSCST